MGQMRVRRTGPWVKISCPFSWVQFISRVGHGVGQAVDPHFDPHIFQHFCNKKHRKPKFSMLFWSCWADSNCRPHPYQEIFGVFYNNFRLFLVVFIPNNVVSRTFVKCSLRCFHACLWWNCGQPAICVDSACANRIDSASQITPQFLRKSI